MAASCNLDFIADWLFCSWQIILREKSDTGCLRNPKHKKVGITMSNQEKKGSGKKVLSVVINVLIWIFVAFSLVITMLVFSAQNNSDGIPSIGGKSILTIATDSMKDTFSAGDMIIIKKVTPEESGALQVGDIITYRSPVDLDGDGRNGDINTHRIVEVDTAGQSYVTKGDNNAIADNEGDMAHSVPYSAVIGVYNGKHVSGLGSVLDFLRTSMGFFVCVVLPMILFFIYELAHFISVLVAERAARREEKNSVDEEEIKRRAVEEYLQKQAAEQARMKQDENAAPSPDDKQEHPEA